jgi:hypothetical protein
VVFSFVGNRRTTEFDADGRFTPAKDKRACGLQPQALFYQLENAISPPP